jgi:3,4-dihydroxy 2-butanone 4-phosphate synthase/GTP cyclohydrolase II
MYAGASSVLWAREARRVADRRKIRARKSVDLMSLNSIPEIIAELKAGRMAVLVDDEDRENEGDLIFAAEFVTAEKVNFMAKFGRGLVCMPITEAHAERLSLLPMVARNRSVHGTNFTVSIEAASGVTTGISAADRAHTIKVAASSKATPADIVQPGHVFPLIAQNGGVLVRAGHTEACCDLVQLAGLYPAAVLCEIMKDDGSMARLPDLVEFSKHHGLKIGSIADLIRFRSQNESLVKRVTERTIATRFGPFRLIAYLEKLTGETHLALARGEVSPDKETLVRVHEPLSLLDLLDTGQGTHSWSVDDALERIAEEGKGIMVLLNCSEGAGQLIERVASAGRPKAPARMDFLTYGIGAQILRDLKVGRMRLMAAPRKMPSMAGWELEIAGYVEKAAKARDG